MIHVIDVSAFLALVDCVHQGVYTDVLNDLIDVIREGDLTFPKEVIDDLQYRARGEPLDLDQGRRERPENKSGQVRSRPVGNGPSP